MALFKISGFLGENRAIQPSLPEFPASMGVLSVNQKPGRGDLRPLKAASNVSTATSGYKTIYRMGRDVASDTNYWLAWANPVNVVRGFNADDPSELTCFTSQTLTGAFTPKYTNKWIATASAPYPTASRELGIPAPAAAPTVSAPQTTVTAGSFVTGTAYVIVTAGTTDYTLVGASSSAVGTVFTATGAGSGTGTVRTNTDMETRYYCYTYVNSIGWESAPSPISAAVSCRTDAAATISAFSSAPAGNYDINRIRVYRTQTGSTGATDFYFLRELGTVSSASSSVTRGTAYTVAALGSGGDAAWVAVGATAPVSVGDAFVASVTATVSGSGTATTTTLSTASTTDDLRTLGDVLETMTWLPAPGIPQGGTYNLTEPYLVGLTGMWNGMMGGICGRSVRICVPYVPYAYPIEYEILPAEVTPVAMAAYGQTLVVGTDGKPFVVTGGSPDAMDQQPVEFLQPCVSAASMVSLGHGVAWASGDGLCYLGAGGARVLTDKIMLKDDWQALAPSTIVGAKYEGRYVGFYPTGVLRNGVTTYGFVFDPQNPGGLYFLDFQTTALYFDELQNQLYLLNGANIQKWDAGSPLTALFRSKVLRAPRPLQALACAQVNGDAYPTTFKLYCDNVLKHTQTVTSAEPFRLPSGFYWRELQVELSTANNVQEVVIAHSMTELAQA